jgi:RNA polymerase sigma-70 factor (ECF subfamily)
MTGMASVRHPSMSFDEFHARLLETLPRLRGFALPFCGTAADADDAMQLTCEKALERWRQWSGQGPLEHWLRKILINSWRDELRSRSRRAGPPIEALPEVRDASDPTDRLYLAQVNTEIMKLPQGQREVMLLVAGEGFSYSETARSLGIPVGTVMSRLCRARHTLIDRLGLDNG